MFNVLHWYYDISHTHVLQKKIDHCKVKHSDLLYISVNGMIVFRFSRFNPHLWKKKIMEAVAFVNLITSEHNILRGTHTKLCPLITKAKSGPGVSIFNSVVDPLKVTPPFWMWTVSSWCRSSLWSLIALRKSAICFLTSCSVSPSTMKVSSISSVSRRQE